MHCSGAGVEGGTAVAALFFCDAEVPESLEVRYTAKAAAGTAASLLLLFAEKDELSVTVLHPDAWCEDMLEQTQLHLLDHDMSCEMLRSCSSTPIPTGLSSVDTVRPFRLYTMCALPREGVDGGPCP